MIRYEKNMLSKDLMYNVDENAYESDSSGEDPIMSSELEEDEIKHGPFEFPHDDEIPFSKLLFNLMVWQVQRSDNGDANPNMPLLEDDDQVFDAPPQAIHVLIALNQDTSMQLVGSMEMDPPISANTPLI